MPTRIDIDMQAFKKNLVARTQAAGYSLAQLRAVQAACAARTETTPQGDAAARIVSLALFGALVAVDEPNTGPSAVYLEDRITNQVTLKP